MHTNCTHTYIGVKGAELLKTLRNVLKVDVRIETDNECIILRGKEQGTLYAYIHTYMHTYIHTYIHTHIHIHIGIFYVKFSNMLSNFLCV